jgi:5-oxoprolinase (ATP-hydrolysing)
MNTLIRKEGGRKQNIGGKASIPVFEGDVFLLETPGGGGYGDPALAGKVGEKSESTGSGKGRATTGTSGVASGGSLGEYAANQESA